MFVWVGDVFGLKMEKIERKREREREREGYALGSSGFLCERASH